MTTILYVRDFPDFVSPERIPTAGEVTVTGQRCDLFPEAVASIEGIGVGRATADGLGRFALTFRLPVTVGPGDHSILITCVGADTSVVMSNAISVVAASVSPALPFGGAPAFTG